MDEGIEPTVADEATLNFTEAEPSEVPKWDFTPVDERPNDPKLDLVDEFPTTDERPNDPKWDVVENFPTTDKHAEVPMLNSSVGQTSFSTLDLINQRIREEWAAKEMEENRRREALREQARIDLQNWYKEREQQLTTKLQRIKTEEQTMLTDALEKSSKDSCDWSKVIRMLEFSPGTPLSKSKRDLSRIKEAMINASRQQAMKNSN